MSVFFNSFGLFDKEKLCASLVNIDPCSGLECHLTTAIFSTHLDVEDTRIMSKYHYENKEG